MNTTEQLFIKMVLDAWHTYIKRTGDLFHSLSDEQLLKEITPGRNRGVYLLGHLTAVHDRMLPLLDLGNSLYPHLYPAFVETPDNALHELPGVESLRKNWSEVNVRLASLFSDLTPAEWFQKHTAVTDEDFAKEPHRNKLNLIINRTNHLANHYGQLLLLKARN